MLQVKLVDGEEYALREVTIRQTTRFLWCVVDLLEESAKSYDRGAFMAGTWDKAEELTGMASKYRGMAGEIKRQLVDDLAKEIDGQIDNRTNVSRETIDISNENWGVR